MSAVYKVLLVDDDPSMLRLLSHWLKQAGYAVQVVPDGLQALESIKKDCPDFLITDWEMPFLNGLELCRQVRALKLPHYVYALILTSKSAATEKITGLENGADEFLCKPLMRAELEARLRAGARVVELERRLNIMASTDGLTGLMTQRIFYEILQKEWHRSERQRLPVSCVMVDLDFFKRINDTHGHPAGDSVLKLAAELIRDKSRASDSVCRYGGEEFCILLPETTEEAAAAWAERVRAALASLRIPNGGECLQITGSFGVAERYVDTHTPEKLVDQADQALLCAKRSGRDRVVRYQSLNESNNLAPVGGADDVFAGVEARHMMTPMVVCLREEETIGQAAEFFLRSRINSTPVVDSKGKLVGMLSEKDLMVTLVSLDYWELPVRDVMKSHVITYEESTPVRTIYEFLCRVSIRRVVIVKNEQPVGSISRATLLRWFRNLVVGRGLAERKDSAAFEANENDRLHCKERLVETARQLVHQASELLWQFHKHKDDMMPLIVGGATGMQELLDDLLAYSRFASANKALIADATAAFGEGCYME
jgi:diguanylate cyclase (GGDEF)-like protein